MVCALTAPSKTTEIVLVCAWPLTLDGVLYDLRAVESQRGILSSFCCSFSLSSLDVFYSLDKSRLGWADPAMRGERRLLNIGSQFSSVCVFFLFFFGV